MENVYSYLVEYQNKNNEELQREFDSYKEKFNIIVKDYFSGYRSTYEYRGLTVKHMILNYSDLFYSGLYSFMELKNRKINNERLYDYFNTEILTTELALFYLYPVTHQVKINEVDCVDDKIEENFLEGLFSIELCNYILFDSDFLAIIKRVNYLDKLITNETKVLPILLDYLNKQDPLGKQLIMEFKLKK